MLSVLMTSVAMFVAQVDQAPQAVAAAPVAGNSGSAPVSAAAAPAPAPVAKPTQYCVKGVVTGSRMVRKNCKTRAEWLKEGFDPTETD